MRHDPEITLDFLLSQTRNGEIDLDGRRYVMGQKGYFSLDGHFKASELRAMADWLDSQNSVASESHGKNQQEPTQK